VTTDLTGISEEDLVDVINATPTKVVLFVAGGGLGVFKTLTHLGGGSGTLISGLIPYDPEETIELLGHEPEKLVCEETTRMMAMVAFQRALKISKGKYPVIGVASSSILQKTPEEREGRVHYIYTALQTDSYTMSATLEIPPKQAPLLAGSKLPKHIRLTEEELNAEMILKLIAKGCGIPDRYTSLSWLPGDLVVTKRSTLEDVSLTNILAGKVAFDCYNNGDIKVNYKACPGKVVFPGSFRPVHDGHWEMADVAASKFHSYVEYEISINNADKPMTDLISLEERLKGFTGNDHGVGNSVARVWVTNAPTFIKKSALFPGATFVVGYDTALRIVDPKFAGPVADIVKVFRENDTSFLVFGREQNGEFKDDVESLPGLFQTLIYHPMPQRLKHAGVSSTVIRKGILQ